MIYRLASYPNGTEMLSGYRRPVRSVKRFTPAEVAVLYAQLVAIARNPDTHDYDAAVQALLRTYDSYWRPTL